MENPLQLNYDLGDTITCYDKSSELFNRKSSVVYVDPVVVGVITEGITRIIFFNYDILTIKVVEKGNGFLTNEMKEEMKRIMTNWDFVEFVKCLPHIVDISRKFNQINDKEKMYIKIDAFVPKEVGTMWKQFNALMDMVKQTNPDVPNYIHALFVEWVLLSSLQSLKILGGFKSQ
jgi:hypothetical protein